MATLEVLRREIKALAFDQYGTIELVARQDDASPDGVVFIPFAFVEAAANLLTNPALDPIGKIAELKYCAVKIVKGGKLEPLASYGGGQSFTETAPACD